MISFEISMAITLTGFCIYGVNRLMACSNYWIGFAGVVIMGVGGGMMFQVIPYTAFHDGLIGICVGGACP